MVKEDKVLLDIIECRLQDAKNKHYNELINGNNNVYLNSLYKLVKWYEEYLYYIRNKN